MLFTCIKSWFFRNHLAIFYQIAHWSFCWNVIDSLFKWSCSIDCQAHIFFFKTKSCSNDDIFISCDDRIGKMLHNICMSAWLCHSGERTVARGPLVFFYFILFYFIIFFFFALRLEWDFFLEVFREHIWYCMWVPVSIFTTSLQTPYFLTIHILKFGQAHFTICSCV